MLRSSLLIFLLALSTSASAEFDYNFFEFSYADIEFDDIDVDGDALGIGGSFELNDDVFLFGSYQAADLDFSVDATTFGIGVGYHTPLSPVVDLVASVSYQWVEVDVPGFGEEDEDGFGLGVGVRFAATPEVELNGGINYVDLGDGGDDTALSIGALYNFTDAFTAGIGGSFGDDVSSIALIARLYFGR